MSFEILAIGSVAAALGVIQVITATPIYDFVTSDDVTGELGPVDQEPGDLSEIEEDESTD